MYHLTFFILSIYLNYVKLDDLTFTHNGTGYVTDDEEVANEDGYHAYNIEEEEHDVHYMNIRIMTKLEFRIAVKDRRRFWTDGVVPYVLSKKYDSKEKNIILEGMEAFNKDTCIRFIPRTKELVYISVAPGTGCSATIGRFDSNGVKLGRGCYKKGIVIHELMHVLGFVHEQSRPDRDAFVTINYHNILPKHKKNFDKTSKDRIQTGNISYDYGSIMHYGPYTFAKDRNERTVIPLKEGVEIGQREDFSKKDLQKINLFYHCRTQGRRRRVKRHADHGSSPQIYYNKEESSLPEVVDSQYGNRRQQAPAAYPTHVRAANYGPAPSSGGQYSLPNYAPIPNPRQVYQPQAYPSSGYSIEERRRASYPSPAYPKPAQAVYQWPPYSEAEQPKLVYSQPVQPKLLYSQPEQPKLLYSQPEQPKLLYSDSEQPQIVYPPAEQPKIAYPQPYSPVKSNRPAYSPVEYRRENYYRPTYTTAGYRLPYPPLAYPKPVYGRPSYTTAGYPAYPPAYRPAYPPPYYRPVEYPPANPYYPVDPYTEPDPDTTVLIIDPLTTEQGSTTLLTTTPITTENTTPTVTATESMTLQTTTPVDTTTSAVTETTTVITTEGTSTVVTTTTAETTTLSPTTTVADTTTTSVPTTVTTTAVPTTTVTQTTTAVPTSTVIQTTTAAPTTTVSPTTTAVPTTTVTPTTTAVPTTTVTPTTTAVPTTTVIPTTTAVPTTTVTPTTTAVPTTTVTPTTTAVPTTTVTETTTVVTTEITSTVPTTTQEITSTVETTTVSETTNATEEDIDNTKSTPMDYGYVPYQYYELQSRGMGGFVSDRHVHSSAYHRIRIFPNIQGRTALRDPSAFWSRGIVPYEFSDKYDAQQKGFLLEAMQEFHNKTCVRFVPRKNQASYIFVEPEIKCSATIGKVPGRVNNVKISEGCYLQGTIIHELMHTLGFVHEQNRPDRDQYVIVMFDNIIPDAKKNFKKYTWEEVQDLGVSYDYESVMHYSQVEFALDPDRPTLVPLQSGVTLGQRDGFSKKDLIKINKLYKCRTVQAKEPVTPSPVEEFRKYFQSNIQRLFRNLFRVIQTFKPSKPKTT